MFKANIREWKELEFSEVFRRVPLKKYQLQKQSYLPLGRYPIVDQGKQKIVAYSNSDNPVSDELPIIVFGDHTREVKWVDFECFLGADGTQPLSTNEVCNIKFGYFLLEHTEIPSMGYSRHFSHLKEKLFILPPLPEQKKIAEILGACDEAIEAQERLIAQKQQRKKGLMQKLLTAEVRFLEFEGTAWREVRLGDVFSERKETKREDLELLAVTGGGGVVKRDGLSRKDTSSEDKSKYKRVCPGDIAYNTMRMWQGVCGLSRYDGIVSPAYTILTPSNEMDPSFSSYFFKLPETISLFHRYSQGLVKDTLNLKYPNFKVIKVTIPERDEQEAIGQALAISDEEITLQKNKLEQLKQQKKSLMQKLLTGKVRVMV